MRLHPKREIIGCLLVVVVGFSLPERKDTMLPPFAVEIIKEASQVAIEGAKPAGNCQEQAVYSKMLSTLEDKGLFLEYATAFDDVYGCRGDVIKDDGTNVFCNGHIIGTVIKTSPYGTMYLVTSQYAF